MAPDASHSTAQQTRIQAIAAAAADWQDPEYPPRAEAVSATLEAPNRFTEQALAFAINQQMAELTPEALRGWVGGTWADMARTIGVLNAGNIPLVGLQDLLAVVLTGHDYLGTLSSKSPHLLPAFVDEIRNHESAFPAAFEDAEMLFERADAIIATGSDETASWVAELEASVRGVGHIELAAVRGQGHRSHGSPSSVTPTRSLPNGACCAGIGTGLPSSTGRRARTSVSTWPRMHSCTTGMAAATSHSSGRRRI